MILKEYEATVFLLESAAGQLQGSFGIVTACNPATMLPEAGNRLRAEALARSLQSDGRVSRLCRIEGCSPDLCHREESMAVWGLTLQETVELGNLWNQNAIFWVEDGKLAVVGCRSGSRVELGKFFDRVREQKRGGGRAS